MIKYFSEAVCFVMNQGCLAFHTHDDFVVPKAGDGSSAHTL